MLRQVIGLGSPLWRDGVRLGMRISARNQLAGTVVSVDHGAVMSVVVIRLEGGQEVVSAITKDSAEGLELVVGDAVTAVIKSTDVTVAKD